MFKTILCALTVVAICSWGLAAHAQEVAGYWTGVLNGQIHLLVHLTKTSGGTYQGSIENTDNESGPVPLSTVVAKAADLHLKADQVGGHYDGTWDSKQHGWIGKWTMQGQTLPLILTHADAPRKSRQTRQDRKTKRLRVAPCPTGSAMSASTLAPHTPGLRAHSPFHLARDRSQQRC